MWEGVGKGRKGKERLKTRLQPEVPEGLHGGGTGRPRVLTCSLLAALQHCGLGAAGLFPRS